MPKTFTVDKDYQDSRFDRWFKNKVIDIPHSLIEKLIRRNKVKVNKKKIKSSYRLQTGDLIEIYDISKLKPVDKKEKIKYLPKKKEIGAYDDYVIEDNENFIVINKPTGIPVQSGTKSFKNIIDILKNSTYFENSKPFIVHRLDKETSGVLIIAKNRKYAQLLTSLFRIRKIHKTYLAIVSGKIDKSIKVMKDDLIYYENNKKISQKAVSNFIGCPIIGDDKYFLNTRKRIKTKNLMLHAYKIKFMINNIQYNFKAKYNKLFEDFLKKNI